MKNFIFLVLIFCFSMPCFAEDDGFMEEFIDLDLEQSQVQSEVKTDTINKEKEEEINIVNEFNVFKEKNEKEISELKKRIENEEDGIIRLELDSQIKTKKIELEAKEYILTWNDKINEMSIQNVIKEAGNIRKQTTNLLNDYENILETKNDFMLDKIKSHVVENQSYEQLEELILLENKNKILVSMVKAVKPFVEQLNTFQRDYFKSEGNNKVKISSLYKSGSNFVNLKIIYISEQTVIYNLKYKISDFDKEDKALVGKSSKEFTITPVFSVTQNNNGTLAKVLTGFNVKNSVVGNEQIVKISANIKEIFEIERYKKMLAQYNE